MTTHDSAHRRSLFLSLQQRELLTAVVDRLIPPGDNVPGAGEVGVGEHVEGITGVSARSRAQLANGLKDIEATAGRRHSKGYVNLSGSAQTEVLEEVELRYPEFFKTLIQETYAGYYGNRKVLQAKGLPLPAPQPDGYEIEPFDASLLEGVRKRGKAYRDA